MGVVYKARPRLSYELVALKMMSPEVCEDVTSVRRFRRDNYSTAQKLSRNVELGPEPLARLGLLAVQLPP